MPIYTGPSISLHVKVFIAPEDVPRFKEALKPVFDAVTAEPECLFFEIYYNPDKPGEFKWVENWNQSKEWLMSVQIQKEYYKPYFAITEPMFIKPREVELWERFPGNEWVVVKKEMIEKVSSSRC